MDIAPSRNRSKWKRRAGETGTSLVPEMSRREVLRLRWIRFKNDRPDKRMQSVVQQMITSWGFRLFMVTVILLNCIVIAIETDPLLLAEHEGWFRMADWVFFSIYVLEFLFKVYAKPFCYWACIYSLFEFSIIILAAVQLGLEATGSTGDAVRALKALRALRILRLIAFFKGLQILAAALLHVIVHWLINILLVLLLLMYLFGVMAVYFFGYRPNAIRDEEHWGTLGRAFLTLFSFLTVDGWTDVQNDIDDRGLAGSRIFTMVFIFVGHFIITNIFIGVIIASISGSAEQYKMEKRKRKLAGASRKQEFMLQRQQEDLNRMKTLQAAGDYGSFEEMARLHERELKHHNAIIVPDLTTNVLWLESFLQTLDHMDKTMYRSQQLYFEMGNTLATSMDNALKEQIIET